MVTLIGEVQVHQSHLRMMSELIKTYKRAGCSPILPESFLEHSES